MTKQETKLLAEIVGNAIIEKIKPEIEQTKEEALQELLNDIKKEGIDFLVQELEIPNIVKIENKPTVTHTQFMDLFKLIQLKTPLLLVGEPGTGKTITVKMVADSLKLPFHSISVGHQTTKSDILGFIDATGNYRATGFRKAFENGGIFLMDEIDAGNPNVLIQINSAISNGFLEFPDKMVEAHKDFIFIGTANTYGTGGDIKFVGRNQLDAATLDRFLVMDWKLDTQLESHLAMNDAWIGVIRSIRKYVSKNSIDLIVSARMSINGAKMLRAGFHVDQVLDYVVFKGLSRDLRQQIKSNLDLTGFQK